MSAPLACQATARGGGRDGGDVCEGGHVEESGIKGRAPQVKVEKCSLSDVNFEACSPPPRSCFLLGCLVTWRWKTQNRLFPLNKLVSAELECKTVYLAAFMSASVFVDCRIVRLTPRTRPGFACSPAGLNGGGAVCRGGSGSASRRAPCLGLMKD